MRYENGRFRTTNYRKGLLLPINTRVTLQSIGRKNIKVAIEPSGQEFLIENVEKYTGTDLNQTFDRIFRKQPVNLKNFIPLEKEHINRGSVAAGMHKAAVLAAIGYPPIHETPTLDSSEWTYWNNRFDKFVVNFRNGVVTSIRN